MILVVTANECIRKNEIHWTMLSFFSKHNKFERGKKDRKNHHLIALQTISFSPTVNSATWWNSQAGHGSRINRHMLFNSKNNVGNLFVYIFSF